MRRRVAMVAVVLALMERPRATAIVACLLAAFALFAPRLLATTTVVFRTSTRIVLAADSLEVTYHNKGAKVGSGKTCKIRQAGRWHILLTGYGGSPGEHFDVKTTIAKAIAASRTIEEAQSAIVARAIPDIRGALERARHSKAFAQLLGGVPLDGASGQLIAMVYVAGMDDDHVPRVLVLALVLKSLEPFQLDPVWWSCPGRACVDGTFYAGTGPAIVDRLTAPLRDEWVRRADSAAAKRLILMQLAAAPKDVRPPIDVLEITARGAKWMGRDPASTCPEIRTP